MAGMFDNGDVMTSGAELEGAGEACDTGSNDEDLHVMPSRTLKQQNVALRMTVLSVGLHRNAAGDHNRHASGEGAGEREHGERQR
jgi:hypothetical protein